MRAAQPAGPGTCAAAAPGGQVSYHVRTSALDQLCTDLQRAVDQGRQLLEHPGVVRGRAQDGGDEDLRDAAVLLADRWQWGLQVLVDDAETLLHDVRAATLVYDQVERTSVPAVTASRGQSR